MKKSASKPDPLPDEANPEASPIAEPAPASSNDEGSPTLPMDSGLPAGEPDTMPTYEESDIPSGKMADKGLGAVYPILKDVDIVPLPGLPTEEIPVPPAEASQGAPLFSSSAYLEPGPVAGMPVTPGPAQAEARPVDAEMVRLLLPDEQVLALWTRVDQARTEINERVHTLPIARTLLDQVKSARNELLSGRDRFEEAERFINEVEFRVRQNYQSRRWSYTVGLPLFAYETVWAIAFGWILIGSIRSEAFGAGGSDFIYLVASMLWGGLGGVVGAWLALIRHIAQEQDFDKQHTMWYLSSPLMGAGVGVFIFLVMRAGLLSLTGTAAQPINSPLIFYVLAWLGGYQHNVFTDIVKRILKVFEVGSGSAKTASKETKPEETKPAAEEAASQDQNRQAGGAG